MDPQEQLASTNPDNVRVRIAMPQGFEPDLERTQLKLEFRSEDDETYTADMSLSLHHTAEEVRSTGFFGSDMAVTSYELGLSPEGTKQMRDLQPYLLSEGKISFSVNAPFGATPEEAEEVYFWIDVKLSADEPYLQLIDAARVKFDRS
ncbi:hypothetical protein ACR0ST_03450 [Aliidiomarina sp. Khilg15.8]